MNRLWGTQMVDCALEINVCETWMFSDLKFLRKSWARKGKCVYWNSLCALPGSVWPNQNSPDCQWKTQKASFPVPLPLPGGRPLPQLQGGKGATACSSSAAGDLGWPVAFCFVLPWRISDSRRCNGLMDLRVPITQPQEWSAHGQLTFHKSQTSHILSSVNISVLPLTSEVIFTLHTKIWYYSWLGQNVLITMFFSFNWSTVDV